MGIAAKLSSANPISIKIPAYGQWKNSNIAPTDNMKTVRKLTT